MLIVALASLLAAHPADSPWSVILRPAVVVQDSEASLEAPTVEDAQEAPRPPAPSLVPAKAEKPKARVPKRAPKRSGSR